MADIIIKSFNRPYYLDRCLNSIYRLASGEYRIRVLDDGTPDAYLQKIAALYPEVEIIRSDLYRAKTEAIAAHIEGRKQFDQFTIPTKLWEREIAKSTDIFLLLEDDIWLTAAMDISAIVQRMRASGLSMLRLSWQGNQGLIKGRRVPLDDVSEELKPAISLLSKLIFFNRFKLRSLVFRLGLLGNGMKHQVPFYTLYAVASAAFRKDYWLYLWQDAPAKIEESRQLKKAYEWYQTKGGRYGKLKQEATETSYLTSATNVFGDTEFDVFRLNHYLNEAWLAGSFNAMQGFPKDFDRGYIKKVLDAASDPACSYEAWQKWVERFKSAYRKVGNIVD